MAEFLVELYVACADGGTVAERAEAVSRAGAGVRCLSSIFVPEDETCFLLYEADTLEDLRDAARRAGLEFERVALAHATNAAAKH